MNIVLLSGGSGNRLWPLSNDTQSKQFLKLLKNRDGEYESMVQRVVRQIRKVQPKADISIACNTNQIEIINRQLSDVSLIAEPCRRDTFPAIVLSAAYLRYKKNMKPDEAFVVCPIDTFAQDEYFKLLSGVWSLVDTNRYAIGLLGVVPAYPSAKYGYIIRNDSEVAGFTEKPSADEASELIAGGALWNCGVFAFKIGYILSAAGKYVQFDCFGDLYDKYVQLPKISIDYEVTEKEKSIGCLVYDGIWKDLGTWNTLTEEMDTVSIGDNVLISDSCENSHILNMLNIPLVAQDIKNTVVVASHDGILVSSKTGSSYIKPLVEMLDTRPMYEQRQWGTYRVLDCCQTGGSTTIVKRQRLDAGKSFDYRLSNSDGRHSEVWIILSGKGTITADGIDSALSPGSVAELSSDICYTIFAAAEIEFISVQTDDKS